MPQSAVSTLLPTSASFTWLQPEELVSRPLRAGVAWWRMARGDRPYPTRDDLNPRQMPGVLPYMSLLKVINRGEDFEHRIVGDVMVRAFNVPIQNRRFSEIAPEAPLFIARCFENFRKVVNSKTPLAWHAVSGRESIHVVFNEGEVVLLPLGHAEVDHILGLGNHWSTPVTGR